MGELCDNGKEIRRRAKMYVEAWRAGWWESGEIVDSGCNFSYIYY